MKDTINLNQAKLLIEAANRFRTFSAALTHPGRPSALEVCKPISAWIVEMFDGDAQNIDRRKATEFVAKVCHAVLDEIAVFEGRN